ncbi:MAG: hypothetical protein KKA67_02655 [Spirochaetes bacterium]|nr:hypothetical protein [Spirochaetota bacterium]MBU1080164.1 hypothetical protein [Spirochaetota bacterium]
MTKRELAGELGGILGMLRDHAFLRYAPSGAAEYEEKQRSAGGHFAAIISRATGVPVPNPFPYAGLEGLSSVSAQTVDRAVKRTAAKLAAAQGRAEGAEAAVLARASEAWRKAAEAVSALQAR